MSPEEQDVWFNLMQFCLKALSTPRWMYNGSQYKICMALMWLCAVDAVKIMGYQAILDPVRSKTSSTTSCSMNVCLLGASNVFHGNMHARHRIFDWRVATQWTPRLFIYASWGTLQWVVVRCFGGWKLGPADGERHGSARYASGDSASSSEKPPSKRVGQ